MEYLRGFFGFLGILAVAYLFSSHKKNIDWKLVATGVFLQFVFGLLIGKVPFVSDAFLWVSKQFVQLLSFSLDGSRFLLGDFADTSKVGFIFAFQVLPVIVFFASLTSGLYYLGVLQYVVRAIAWVMSRSMRLSGAEALSVAGNIFLGQTEAPLLIRPFIAKMTYSELMCLMTGGMSTIAGGVLAGYVSFLGGDDPVEQTKYASYLLSASIMNAPAAIVMAKIFIPEIKSDDINTSLEVNKELMGVNLIDALARGASEGLKIALNVAVMLLAFIALIAMVNYGFEKIGALTGINEYITLTSEGQFTKLSMEFILGWVFRLFAVLIGVSWNESLLVGSLLGQKMVINEFVAYLGLADMKSMGQLSERSIIIATYSLCGFANFSSIAIQIGGIGSMAPKQQGNLSKLGLRAVCAATLATMMTGTIAGMII